MTSYSPSKYALICYYFLTRFSRLLFSYVGLIHFLSATNSHLTADNFYAQYIPIFYQAVKHHLATASGIDLLPFMLGTVMSWANCWQNWVLVHTIFFSVFISLILAAQFFA
jgi:hypothetical protein